MRCILHAEIPPLNCALETLTFACRTHVDKLANLEVTRPQAVTNREEALLGDGEFSEMSFWRQVVLQHMADLGLLHFVRHDFANTNLNCIDTIFFFGFDLSYLASVDLDNGARLELTPFIPEVGAADLVADQT